MDVTNKSKTILNKLHMRLVVRPNRFFVILVNQSKPKFTKVLVCSKIIFSQVYQVYQNAKILIRPYHEPLKVNGRRRSVRWGIIKMGEIFLNTEYPRLHSVPFKMSSHHSQAMLVRFPNCHECSKWVGEPDYLHVRSYDNLP